MFITNPSNPPSYALSPETTARIVNIVKNDNPNLMIITDDVYGTFIPHFRSLMAELPHNTLCVYSFSKYFGATGWRNAVIALHEDNIYDKMIARLSEEQTAILNKRYASLSLHPEKMKFIDRMVADSRQIALNHTAGLSLPQQMQMSLFAAFSLLDKEDPVQGKDAGNHPPSTACTLGQHRLHVDRRPAACRILFGNRHAGMGEEILR